MEYRIGFFISVFILSFLQFVVHAVAIPDLFSDKNDLESDTASYEPDKFDEELSPLSSFLDDTDNSDTGLFASSNKDECSSWMSADNSNLFSMEQEARLRPRAESCPNQESSKVDIGLPNFGLFQPGSNLFNLVNPPETPLKPPTQIFPELPEHKQDPIRNELNRLFGLPTMDYGTEATNGDEDDNPCPPMLVSDLAIPVCDSGDWARDVLRIAGEYFFDLFNIRACKYVLDRLLNEILLY